MHRTIHRVRIASLIVLSWTLIALFWTPPTWLVQRYSSRHSSPVTVFVEVFVIFVPWMLVTPLLLALARRFPVTEARILRPLLVHGAIGLGLVPILTAAGMLPLAWVALGAQRPLSFPGMFAPVAITAFYSVPTYIAVAGIGQALAYFERYRTREHLLARAELKALEAQLNPHFLFNTLNAISALGYRDPARADAALTHLSELLRMTFKDREQVISVKEEVAFARDYLDLYAIIMPDRFDVTWSIDEAAWRTQVPAMLLQPLVENAIVHGVAKDIGEGKEQLDIAIAARNGRILVELRNSTPLNAQGTAGAGIGLANVRERLRVLYGDDARLSFERRAQNAVTVVELPLHEAVA